MSDPNDPVAGEYVLGTLPQDERAEFEAVLRQDPAAAEAVVGWQRTLAPLDALAKPVEPGAETWRRILRRIGPEAANDRGVAPGWRRAAIAAMLVAGLSSGLAYQGWQRPEPAPMSSVATLTPDGTTPALLVGWHADTGRYEVRPIAMPAVRGRANQLWLIVDGAGPRSMGLVGGAARWIDGSALQPGTAATIAVSREPEGGSRTGAPTGPVVLSGRLVRMADEA